MLTPYPLGMLLFLALLALGCGGDDAAIDAGPRGDCADGEFCDRDGDGFVADRPTGGNPDCDDTNAEVHPDHEEFCTPAGGIVRDDDCDGFLDELKFCDGDDLDGDGSAICTAGASDCDCNDCDPGVHPGATEVPCNAVDEDCDGSTTPCSADDMDGDGFTTGDDCDDTSALVFPGASERCDTPSSESCGTRSCPDDDADEDGWAETPFCEMDPTITPSPPETCNQTDDDCDGRVDEMLDPTRGCIVNSPIDYATDVENCGSCRARCNSFGAFKVADACIEGMCACSGEPDRRACAGTLTDSCCDTRCIDLGNDGENCGICGESCVAGSCSGGVCF